MKTEPKHTQGPWHALDFAGWWSIHDEPFYEAVDLLNDEGCEKAYYNARLAATSPEIYDALVSAIKFIKLSIPKDSQPRGLDKWDALIAALNQPQP